MESGRYKDGTTLIEILVVVAVIMILAGLVTGIATSIDSYSKERAVKATFSVLDAALQEYYDFGGSFPLAVNADPNVNCETLYYELSSLPVSRAVLEKISGKVIKDDFKPPKLGARADFYEIYDPWGMVLNYRYNPGDSFPLLTSAGPDRNHTTVGDNITNR
ncbi:MAG: type II secretion system protein [Sedimentisphaerales bacterium]|nr:type II secretion system protein [Sedimentisphaerales bacterium]